MKPEIIFKASSPKEAETLVLSVLKTGFIPRTATIQYNVRKGLPGRIRKINDYPLILEGYLNGSPMRISVTPLAVGSKCDGAYSLHKILKVCGFSIDNSEIFTIRKVDDEGWIKFTLTRK